MLLVVKQRFIDKETGEQREIGSQFESTDKIRIDDLVGRNLAEIAEEEPKAKSSAKKKSKE